jgi:hypothetical protein
MKLPKYRVDQDVHVPFLGGRGVIKGYRLEPSLENGEENEIFAETEVEYSIWFLTTDIIQQRYLDRWMKEEPELYPQTILEWREWGWVSESELDKENN